MSLILAYGGWNAFRDCEKGRRGVAAVAAAGFSVAAVTAALLLIYGTGCGCL